MDPSLALALDRSSAADRASASISNSNQRECWFFARAGYTDGSVEPGTSPTLIAPCRRGFLFRQGLGTAGRHARLRRHHQRPRQFTRGLFRGRRAWHPHRRRAIARLWTGEDPGVVLQLRPDAQHQGRRRLSAHRRPRLQCNARSRESFRGAPPLAVLTRPPNVFAPRRIGSSEAESAPDRSLFILSKIIQHYLERRRVDMDGTGEGMIE